MDTVCVGWTTVESLDQARALARMLVESGLAACVQIDGPVLSLYRWQGKLEEATEYRLAVKFAQSRADALLACLNEHHPYGTPQWLALPVSHVNPAYAQWVCQG